MSLPCSSPQYEEEENNRNNHNNNTNTSNNNNNDNNKRVKKLTSSFSGGSSENNSIDKSSPSDDGRTSNIYINPVDGLSNQHPSLPEMDLEDENSLKGGDSDTFDELPTSIIVTNIHSEVFITDDMKAEMETLFRSFSENVTFQWLKSFRRLRVNYDNAISAANARIKLHQYEFNQKTVINCYFAQPVTPVSHKSLQPPALTKQFLISPPSSPPAGWEPRDENEPLVNHDLLAALANLTPGSSHELHAATDDQPGIIIHTAKVPAETSGLGGAKQQIQQTKCPERT